MPFSLRRVAALLFFLITISNFLGAYASPVPRTLLAVSGDLWESMNLLEMVEREEEKRERNAGGFP